MTKPVVSLEEAAFKNRILALVTSDVTGYCLYEQTASGHHGQRIMGETGEPLRADEEGFEFPRNCKPGAYYIQFYGPHRRPLNSPQTLVTWAGSGRSAGPKPDVREAAQQQLRMARQFTAHDLHPSVLEHPDYLSAQLDHSVSSLAYSERGLLADDTRKAIYTQEIAEVHALASHQRRELASQITTGSAQLERCFATMQAMADQQHSNFAKMNVSMESMLAGVAVMADKIPVLAQKLTTPEPPGSSARAWGEAIAGIVQQCAPIFQDLIGNKSVQTTPRQSASNQEILALLEKLGLSVALNKGQGHEAKEASPPTKIVESKPSGAEGS